MRLSEYIELHNIKVADFAELIGLRSRRVVYAYLEGTKTPSKTTMRRIIEATDGEVMPNDFYIDDRKDSISTHH